MWTEARPRLWFFGETGREFLQTGSQKVLGDPSQLVGWTTRVPRPVPAMSLPKNGRDEDGVPPSQYHVAACSPGAPIGNSLPTALPKSSANSARRAGNCLT